MATTFKSLLSMLGIYDPRQESEEETFAPVAGVAFVSKTQEGKEYLALNRDSDESLYNKRVELPTLCPLDGFIGRSWRSQVLQAEANLESKKGMSLDVLLKDKTGEKAFEIGFGLEAFNPVVREKKKGFSLFIGDLRIARTDDRSSKEGWKFESFGISQSAVILGHLLDRVKMAVELSQGETLDYLPVHPGWITCNSDLRFNLLLTKRVGKFKRSFLEVVFGRMGIPQEKRAAVAIRFGKDALAQIDGLHECTVQVCAEKPHNGNNDMLSDDGVLVVKSFPGLKPGEFGLVRGYYQTANGCVGIVKARIVVNPFWAMAHQDEDRLLDASVDGWSRLGQFKFAPVEAGQILKIFIGLKKDESAEGEKDFFSINQAMTYVGQFDEKSKEKFRRMIASQVNETADVPMSSAIDKDLAKIFEGKDCTINGDAAKFLLGMSSDWMSEENDGWVRRLLKTAYAGRSRDVLRVGVCVTDSVAYADIVRGANGEPVFKRVVRKVPEHAMLVSEKLAERLSKVGNRSITVTRDPVLTATSYLSIDWNRDPIPGFTTRFAFINSVAGPDLGADCDDFTKILIGYKSLVKAGTVPAIDKHCTELDVSSLGAGSIYAWGCVSQAMVGAYVNCLHKSILFGADPNTGEAREIAQACQALVQAIKKPVVPAISFARAKEIADSYKEAYIGEDFGDKECLWTIVHKSSKVADKRKAINAYFGKDYSFEERVDAPEILVSDKARYCLGRMFIDVFQKGSKVPVGRLNKILIECLVKIHNVDLETAGEEELRPVVKDYYAFFKNTWLVTTGKKKLATPLTFWKLGSAIKLAYGAALYWGATSYQSREDIFLQALRALERRSSVAED